MATIQFKRGLATNLPSTTTAGEPIFTTDTGKLYIGNGTTRVLINPDAATTAASADKLTTARTLSVTGDATGSASFDGSANAAIAATLASSGVTAGTYPKVTVDAKGRVTAGAALVAADIPSLASSKITGLGTAAALNTGTASGNIPLLDGTGKLSTAILPSIAINDTFAVATESAMLALTAQRGDIAIRSDLNKSYVLAVDAPETLANWKELLTPTDTVLSVAGRTGAIALTVTDVSGAAPLASPALTGTPTAPTASVAVSTTQLATTSFVHGAIALDRPYESTLTNIKVNGAQAVGTVNTVARGDHVHPTDTTRASLNSPVFTGTPTAPTVASPVNATDQIATTAFVKAVLEYARAYEDDPSEIKMNGVAHQGSSILVPRANHVHPTDTTRAPLASPVFTGTPAAPTATAGTATTQLATTAFVLSQGFLTAATLGNIDGGTF